MERGVSFQLPRGVSFTLPLTPCSLPEDIKVLYCLEADGIQLSGIPKHKATVWGSYEWYLSAGTLTAYASVAYTGEYFTSAFARPWDEVPERHRTDMRLSFLSADRRWNASLFVDNVFDDTYLESAHKVVKKVKTPSPSQPTRKLGSSCTNPTI